MLAWAGTSVVMSDSPESALAAADVIAPPASADGVAVVLEQVLAGGPLKWTKAQVRSSRL